MFSTEILKGLIYGVHPQTLLGVLSNSGYTHCFSKIWKVLKHVGLQGFGISDCGSRL